MQTSQAFFLCVIQVRQGNIYQVWLAVQEDCISVLDYATLVSTVSFFIT